MMNQSAHPKFEWLLLDMIPIKKTFFKISSRMPLHFCQHTRTAVLNTCDKCYDGSIFGPGIVNMPCSHKEKPFPGIVVDSVTMLSRDDAEYLNEVSLKMQISKNEKQI